MGSFAESDETGSLIAEANASYAKLVNLSRWNRRRRRWNRWGGGRRLADGPNTSSVPAASEEANTSFARSDEIESLIVEANASYAKLVNLSRWNRWRRRWNRWGGGRRLANGPNTSFVPAASEEANTSFAGSDEIESLIVEANASYAKLVNLSRWNRWRR